MNLNDPSGLEPASLLFLGGMALGGTLGFGVPYAITKGIDIIRGDKVASDAMHTITPYAATTFGVGLTPGLGAFGLGVGTAIGNSRYASTIRNMGEFAEGAFNSNFPSGITLPSGLGGIAGKIKSIFD